MSTITEPQTNQAILTNLAEWLRAHKERPCPQSSIPVGMFKHWAKCSGGCNGTGTIVDPKYQAAWELVTWDDGTTRSVSGWPDGAVRGLLEQVVEILGVSLQDWVRYFEDYGEWRGSRFRWWGDTQSLGKAIMEALAHV